MCKEFSCIRPFMPQPQQTTWSTFRAQESVKVEATAGTGAWHDLCMLSHLVTQHLPPLVPVVEYFMDCHLSHYQAALGKAFSETVHSKSWAISLWRFKQREWDTLFTTVTQWSVLVPYETVKLKKKKMPPKSKHVLLSMNSAEVSHRFCQEIDFYLLVLL